MLFEASPKRKPPRKSMASKRAIVVNGETLWVTHEEQIGWQLCAGALKGGYREMLGYWRMRDADQTRHRKFPEAIEGSVPTIAHQASHTVGDALVMLKAAEWAHTPSAGRYIALTALGLSMALAAPKLGRDIDETLLKRSLVNPDGWDTFSRDRTAEVSKREVEARERRQKAGEHIGYRSPPRAQRFKPGQSGCPTGRPKRRPRACVLGDQRMPGQKLRGKNVRTVNDEVFILLETQAFRDARFLSLWIRVREREEAWRTAQTAAGRRRQIIITVYNDASAALCQLGIASTLCRPEKRDQLVKLESWFVQEALSRHADLAIGAAEASVLRESMAVPGDLERCLTTTGRQIPL